MASRKDRLIEATDPIKIKENVENTSYNDFDKKRLMLQAERINDEMVNQQIGLPKLVKLTGISQGALGQYKIGKVLIKEDLLQPICDVFGVSRNYLRGLTNAKRYENEELNKLFGFNDDTIDNLSSMPNKDSINFLFGKNRDEVLYFYEKLEEYKKELDKYNEEKEKGTINKVWEQDHLNIAKYYLTEAFNNLINK